MTEKSFFLWISVRYFSIYTPRPNTQLTQKCPRAPLKFAYGNQKLFSYKLSTLYRAAGDPYGRTPVVGFCGYGFDPLFFPLPPSTPPSRRTRLHLRRKRYNNPKATNSPAATPTPIPTFFEVVGPDLVCFIGYCMA